MKDCIAHGPFPPDRAQAGASGSGPSTTLAPLAVRLPVRSGDCVRGMAGQEYLSNRFPKGSFASSQTLGRTSGMRPPVVTSDQVFDPFAGVPPGMTASRLLTPEGWRYLWTRMKGTAQNLYALAQAHKYCKPFKVPAFKEEALRLYEELNASVAAGDRRALIGATAPNVNAMFKRQIKAREDAGVARVEWSLAERPTVKDVTMLQARAAMGDPKVGSLIVEEEVIGVAVAGWYREQCCSRLLCVDMHQSFQHDCCHVSPQQYQ